MNGDRNQSSVSTRRRIVVVGGSAAGPKAAARARRLDEEADITILQEADELSMASCGYPYYVGGEFDDRNQLLCTPAGVVRDPAFFLKAKGIVARTGTEAVRIERAKKIVLARDLRTGRFEELAYDRLILATGAKPKMPPITGIHFSGVRTLRAMRDADFLRKVCDEESVKRAVIVGGGLIGLETCEALHRAGIAVTVVEALPQVLAALDWQLSRLVENHIRAKGVTVITDTPVTEFLGEDGHLSGVKLRDGTKLDCELAVVATGVIPNTKLAVEAGLRVGATGGIAVDRYMKTSDPEIYAAGDCVESYHRITGAGVYAPYGDAANLQGRVAGENAVGGDTVTFDGTIQTAICKVFDFSAGSTGLSEEAARAAGHATVATCIHASPDKPGFMQGRLLVTKLIADHETGRILGAQCVGPGDVSKQVAIWAMSLMGKMSVQDMVNADLPYAPPFSLAIDHSITAAHVLQNKLQGLMTGISALEVKQKLDRGEKPFFLDIRGKDEYAQQRLGIGEHLIPLGALRTSLGELPAERDAEIICFCRTSLRGYEAARVLQSKGWTRVRVMEGGIAAWPYAREK